MKIALAQIDTVVGDFAANEGAVRTFYERARQAGADLVIFPELTLTGYPPRDLLLKRRFVADNLAALDRLAGISTHCGMIVGFVGQNSRRPGREATNSAALLHGGRIAAVRTKTLLPTYDVFDEDRYFEPATENRMVVFNGRKLGITICEDLWNDEDFWRDRRYRRNPALELVAEGAEVILNLSASPWHLGKNKMRQEMLASFAAKSERPLVYCNLVGGNDELIFDGHSLVFDGTGNPLAAGKLFEEDLCLVELGGPKAPAPIAITPMPDEEMLYRALMIGLRDYFYKCGFKSAVVGLSGGIDSAVVACLAAAALGPAHVYGISLPSEFSSSGSLEDARLLAERLGIHYQVISIQPQFEAVKRQLAPAFRDLPEDTTEENIQARLRGVTLMALSNKFGALLLTTGNKSELAVGYCTLYGDMCGGLAVISDVPKTMVYRLARWINRTSEIIPLSTITKPPSAELRPDQTDQDTLPPYDVLDAILEAYVVEGKTAREIIDAGQDAAAVQRIVRLIDFNEYKRRQAAPGLKVTSKAFGVGRRIPVAQRYREA